MTLPFWFWLIIIVTFLDALFAFRFHIVKIVLMVFRKRGGRVVRMKVK